MAKETNTNLYALFVFIYFSAGNVNLTEYEASAAGIIQSFADRFPTDEYVPCITDLWKKEKECL